MANVQLEDGFMRLANELLEALISFKFTEVQYSILLLIIRMSYGCGKKTASFRQWIDIGKMAGIDRQNVKPNLRYLQAAHVLFVDWENIVMALDKNYDHWHVPKKASVDTSLMEKTIRKNLHCNDNITNVITELQKSLPDNTDVVSTLSKSNYRITKKGEIVITELQLVITELQAHASNPQEYRSPGMPKERKEIYKENTLSGPTYNIYTNSKKVATLRNEVKEIMKGLKPCK